MRLLLSDGNASKSDGVYTFGLDKRPSNATTVRVRKADFQYTVPTGSVAPLVVYMRSIALHNAARNKHSAILKANQHDDSVDVIAVLEESHTTARYRLRDPSHVIFLNQNIIRNMDFYFTDPAGFNLAGAPEDVIYDEVEDDFDTPTGQTKTGRIFRSFDTGGSAGDYGVNETLNRIYVSQSDVNWKITFLEFDSESGFDKLTIKEVDSGGSETTIVDEHSGTGLPTPVTYTSTENKLKFYWNSDSSNQRLGFDILLYEDNDGENALLGPVDGAYQLSVSGVVADATFFTELQMDIK